MLYASTLDLIGRTPLVALPALSPPGSMIYGKAEFMNPGGSVKDRAALAIISQARRQGALSPGQPVVEMTSGNMGSGLAVVCNAMGHPFTAVMSRGNSEQRVRMLEALGASVRLIDQVDGSPGQVTGSDIAAAVGAAVDLAKQCGGYYVDQFHNPAGVATHERTTGPEIVADLGGAPDAFVAAVGSGGTFTGVARHLKRVWASVVCAAVEPATSRVLAGRAIENPRHVIQGIGYGSVPAHFDAALTDAFVGVTDEQATACRRRLAQEAGLHVGYSAAANVCAAVELIESGRLGERPRVATILCDTGLKYG